eukprot:9477107-Pyramimonas_sp.AAC.1
MGHGRRASLQSQSSRGLQLLSCSWLEPKWLLLLLPLLFIAGTRKQLETRCASGATMINFRKDLPRRNELPKRRAPC